MSMSSMWLFITIPHSFKNSRNSVEQTSFSINTTLLCLNKLLWYSSILKQVGKINPLSWMKPELGNLIPYKISKARDHNPSLFFPQLKEAKQK